MLYQIAGFNSPIVYTIVDQLQSIGYEVAHDALIQVPEECIEEVTTSEYNPAIIYSIVTLEFPNRVHLISVSIFRECYQNKTNIDIPDDRPLGSNS